MNKLIFFMVVVFFNIWGCGFGAEQEDLGPIQSYSIDEYNVTIDLNKKTPEQEAAQAAAIAVGQDQEPFLFYVKLKNKKDFPPKPIKKYNSYYVENKEGMMLSFVDMKNKTVFYDYVDKERGVVNCKAVFMNNEALNTFVKERLVKIEGNIFVSTAWKDIGDIGSLLTKEAIASWKNPVLCKKDAAILFDNGTITTMKIVFSSEKACQHFWDEHTLKLGEIKYYTLDAKYKRLFFVLVDRGYEYIPAGTIVLLKKKFLQTAQIKLLAKFPQSIFFHIDHAYKLLAGKYELNFASKNDFAAYWKRYFPISIRPLSWKMFRRTLKMADLISVIPTWKQCEKNATSKKPSLWSIKFVLPSGDGYVATFADQKALEHFWQNRLNDDQRIVEYELQ